MRVLFAETSDDLTPLGTFVVVNGKIDAQGVDAGFARLLESRGLSTADPAAFVDGLRNLGSRFVVEEDAPRADSGAVSASGGHGYNPYRAGDGKFAPGAHKQRPKVGRARAAQVEPPVRQRGRQQAKPESAKAAPAAAHAHKALAEAKTAAKRAREKPTEENVAAARQAVAKASRAAGIKNAPAAQSEAAAAAHVRESVMRDPRRQLSTVANHDLSDGKIATQWSHESQAALRSHMDDTIAKYGMSSRDTHLPESKVVEVRNERALASAAAQHYQDTGKIVVNESTAVALHQHGQHDPTELGKRFLSQDPEAERMVEAYRLTMHESVHGHGPMNTYDHHGIMLEEMTTEMSARKIAADVHDVSVWDMRMVGSYTHYIGPTAYAMAQISGRQMPEAHAALARAALDYKRGWADHTTEDPVRALRDLGAHALKHLGVNDEARVDELHQHMLQASEGI